MSKMLTQAFEHHRLGRLAQADDLYCQVLAADPQCADAWHLHGALALSTGNLDAAIERFSQAVKLVPTQAEYHNNLGIALAALGRLDEAAQCHQRAIEVQSGHSGAFYNLALVLNLLQRKAEARRSFERAIQLAPGIADYHEGLGSMLLANGELADAEKRLRRAIELQPNHRQAHCQLAVVYQSQNRLPEAVAACREIVRLDPADAVALRNLAALLDQSQRYDEAAAIFGQLTALQPHDASAWAALGVLRQKQGMIDAAFEAYTRAVKLDSSLQQNLMYAIAHDPRKTPQEIVAAHARWGEQYAHLARSSVHANTPLRDRQLRIGYVSGDLCRHAVANFFEPILVQHDRAQFHLTCFANVAKPDRTTGHFQSLSHSWHAIYGMTDDDVANLIRLNQIDILVDLSGHTADNRLLVFARKPAPVQVTYIGYPCTTGLAAIDYRISDEVLDPLDEADQGTEKIIRLPGGMCCYNPLRKAPPIKALPALAANHITFGSLHRLQKINSRVIDLWCELLHAVPGAKLLLARDTLVGDTLEVFHRHFLARGIAPERLDFRSQFGSSRSHLSVYEEIDIALDTFPYAGGTTSNEAVWMGVPVLTLRGDRPVGRAGAALMHFVGHPEFIAQSPGDYIARGARMATDLAQLAQVRSTLRDKFNASVGNCQAFTRTLEVAYRGMWHAWCAARGG